jgi:hypothetical protein
MTILIVASLATACILTAVESLIISMGKWRGLASLILSLPFCLLLDCRLKYLPAYTLAATFLSLTLSLFVEQIFTGISVREFRGLPEKVNRL